MSTPEVRPAGRGALETWAALAAHQLGESLALVRGAATVVGASSGGLSADARDALRAMAAGTDRAQRFVDDLLDVVRAADEPVVPVAGVELDAALDAAAEELTTHLRQARVRLRRAPLPGAALERAEAERVFIHLLRSAVAAGARDLHVGGALADGRVTVEVTDDGTPPPPGVDLLEPFAPPRGRGPLVGAGVSLIVCRRLAERRSGGLELLGRPDGRTTLRLILPPREEPPA